MKYFEKWLLAPALLLIVYGFITGYGTFMPLDNGGMGYQLANLEITYYFAVWLMVVYLLFRFIRWRHGMVSKQFFISYTALTFFLFLLCWLPGELDLVERPRQYLTIDGVATGKMRTWEWYNRFRVIVGQLLLVTQAFFALYAVFLLIKRPHPGSTA